MAKSAGIPTIAALVEPLVQEKGYSLLEVVWGNAWQRRTLTVYIDKPGGVQVDDCQSLARDIGQLLDSEDLVQGAYLLEVSSPGAERPLKQDSDFLHFQGRYALIRTKAPLAEVGTVEIYGLLRGLEDQVVLLETEQGQLLRIARDDIAKARLAIKF